MKPVSGNHFKLAGYSIDFNKRGTPTDVLAIFAAKHLDPENLPQPTFAEAMKPGFKHEIFALSTKNLAACAVGSSDILGTTYSDDLYIQTQRLIVADFGVKKIRQIFSQIAQLDTSSINKDRGEDFRVYVPVTKAATKPV